MEESDLQNVKEHCNCAGCTLALWLGVVSEEIIRITTLGTAVKTVSSSKGGEQLESIDLGVEDCWL